MLDVIWILLRNDFRNVFIFQLLSIYMNVISDSNEMWLESMLTLNFTKPCYQNLANESPILHNSS